MPQRASVKQPAPAEVLSSLNQGINTYTDPTLCNPKMWMAANNIYSGQFGYIQRARYADVASFLPQAAVIRSLKFFALPGLSNYLLFDGQNASAFGVLYSFDSGASYAKVQRLNPYVDPSGAGSTQLLGPWSREVLQNIVYEMNGLTKQAGRLASAATIESWGLDTPDASPAIVVSAGTSQTITSINRTNGLVTAVLSSALTVPGGNGIGMVNAVGVTTDPSFNGTFLLASGNGTATLTWVQTGFNSSPGAAGSVTTQITKSTGRSYAWAWENANKFHISAPSPSTQFVLYAAQNGQINCIEQGTVSISGANVTGTGTLFSTAWVGRSLWVESLGSVGRIANVFSATSLTLVAAASSVSNERFTVYDISSTNIRLYETADGGATYFRVQRNTWNPGNGSVVGSGLAFFDNGNSEPPAFPFTTETSQLYNIPPPIGAFVKEYQGSLIVYGVNGAGSSFFYSNQTLTMVGQPQESYAPLNQVTLPIQNANINGMVDFPGSLCIWSDKQDMFRLTGLLSDNTAAAATSQGATIAALPYNLGCATPFATALTPLGAIWLTSNAEVWIFTDAYAPKNIGRPVQAILNSIPTSSLGLARMVYHHTNNRNWLCLAVAANSTLQNTTLLILDLDLLASNG
jgi:hypothetical protein